MDFSSKGSNLRWHLDVGIPQYPNKTKSWERPCLLIHNLIQKHFLENKDMNIKITICRFGWVDYIRIRGSSTPLYSGFSKFSFLFLILIQDKMHESVLNNGSLLFITVEPPPPGPFLSASFIMQGKCDSSDLTTKKRKGEDNLWLFYIFAKMLVWHSQCSWDTTFKRLFSKRCTFGPKSGTKSLVRRYKAKFSKTVPEHLKGWHRRTIDLVPLFDPKVHIFKK